MYCHVLVACIALQEFEGDGDSVGQGDVGVGVEQLTTFLEEVYVSDAKGSCVSSFFWYVDVEIFTGAYNKEDGC